MKIGIVGPSYQEESLRFDAQRTINMFPIFDQQGKNVAALASVPGLVPFATCGQGPGRRTFSSQNGRAFVVSGAALWEVLADGSSINRGTLEQTMGNVTIAENSTQLAVCDGKSIFILTYATNAFAKVTDGDLPAVRSVAYMDGYFIAVEVNSGRFYISALGDGFDWDALDFATAEADPDGLQIVVNAAGQLWLMGTLSTEIWSNTGSSDFPFRRVAGAKLEVGGYPFTAIEVDNSLMWVGRDDQGFGVVYRASGFTPERISTSPIEAILQEATDLDDCLAYSYQIDGHWFYVITGGDLPTSLCYDLTTQQWHERAQLNEFGVYEQHIARHQMTAFGLHLAVDRRNGQVYKLSKSAYDNAGEVLSRERIFTHVADEDKRVVYSRLTVDVEPGVGTQSGQGVDPQIALRVSKDGAKTWSDWFNAPIGAVGQYKNKSTWRRLGMAEQITFNVRITDPVKVTLMGAYLT